MIVVRVELWSAVSGRVTELARMNITNDGTSTKASHGHYNGVTFRGRTTADLNYQVPAHQGHLEKWPRKSKHVWCLVRAMLADMGYGP